MVVDRFIYRLQAALRRVCNDLGPGFVRLAERDRIRMFGFVVVTQSLAR